MNKEDFVHKRNRDKGNFYSKDFTLEEINQLIKNEEYAEKWRWNKKHCPSLTEAVEIVERLDKRIEELNEVAKEDFDSGHHNANVEFRIEELQEIRGEKPQRITSTPEGRKALADFEARA